MFYKPKSPNTPRVRVHCLKPFLPSRGEDADNAYTQIHHRHHSESPKYIIKTPRTPRTVSSYIVHGSV